MLRAGGRAAHIVGSEFKDSLEKSRTSYAVPLYDILEYDRIEHRRQIFTQYQVIVGEIGQKWQASVPQKAFQRSILVLKLVEDQKFVICEGMYLNPNCPSRKKRRDIAREHIGVRTDI